MQIYVAVHDVWGKRYLIGKRRWANSWWDGAITPLVHVLDEPWQYCLPKGERQRSETNRTAAARIFYEQTGYKLPRAHWFETMKERDGYALVSIMSAHLHMMEEDINKGLQPRPDRPAAPANTEVLNWELEKVGLVQQADLERILCATTVKEREYVNGADRALSLQRYQQMVAILKTLD